MDGTRSPNPSMIQKQRVPVASLIQSPTSPFFLGSNDDKLERAQARAARAAAIRRKSVTINALPQQDDHDSCLGKQQILELFNNCIKLASENVCTLPILSPYWILFSVKHSNLYVLFRNSSWYLQFLLNLRTAWFIYLFIYIYVI